LIQGDEKGKDRKMVELNEGAVLGEIERLGKGLIKQVEVRRMG
jgi:hypothetical protein